MMRKDIFTASCIQNRADTDGERALDEIATLAGGAREAGADLICLPEFCHQLYVDKDVMETGDAPEAEHPALRRLGRLAADLDAWLLVGSVAVRDADGGLRNRSLLLDNRGQVTARYDKIHMFDVNLSSGESYRESARFTPGENAVVADTPFGRMGLTICYDLRFAYLYRLLAQNGANILTVPAAFTHTTGQAHWHVLLRSRAIETGSFILAPAQYGYHGKARTYGHSMIIDPWGKILAEAGDEAAAITATIDLELVDKARRRIPALSHDRTFTLTAT